MAFRVVLIENNMDIKLRLDNLVFMQEDDEVTIPINDISAIVIDNLKVSITARTLCRLAEQNVVVMFCDQHHLPMGMYSAYDNHSRMSKVIRHQINRDAEFNEALWRDIVYAKILNQKKHLEIQGSSEEAIYLLDCYMSEISPGDKTNREAHAAKVYFNELMGTSFSRGNENLIINSGLDYGYAILRSYIARLCVGYGLNTQLGIHHRNEFNRFNLVDDLIEPFRPIVDMVAIKIMGGAEYFMPEHRQQLVNILNHKLLYNSKHMFLSSVLEEYVSAIARLIVGDEDKVIYPDIGNYRGMVEGDEV